MKILIALRYYAVGCFAEPLADMFGVSRKTACDIVTEVSFLIGLKMRNAYMQLPNDPNYILQAKAKFHRLAHFPLVIAAVDGSHIRIQSLGGDNAELYRNRKGYFSINCQAAVAFDVSDSYIVCSLYN